MHAASLRAPKSEYRIFLQLINLFRFATGRIRSHANSLSWHPRYDSVRGGKRSRRVSSCPGALKKSCLLKGLRSQHGRFCKLFVGFKGPDQTQFIAVQVHVPVVPFMTSEQYPMVPASVQHNGLLA
jgi:hypothetical protein